MVKLSSLFAFEQADNGKESLQQEEIKDEQEGRNSRQSVLNVLLGLDLEHMPKTKSPQVRIAKSKGSTYARLVEKASKGHAFAQLELGRMYLQGDGVRKDYVRARNYLKKALSNKSQEAGVFLGDIYLNGLGVRKDPQAALNLYHAAAKVGSAEAQIRLGKLYLEGEVVAGDVRLAWEFYRLAARQEHAEAFYMIGYMYYYGHGVRINYRNARRYFQMAARSNHVSAIFMIAMLFYRGQGGVVQNYPRAMTWLKRAAILGHVQAQCFLGGLFAQGMSNSKGQPKFRQSFIWYLAAAKQGDVTAQLAVAMMYEKGLGVTQNLKKANFWHNKATSNLNSTSPEPQRLDEYEQQ